MEGKVTEAGVVWEGELLDTGGKVIQAIHDSGSKENALKLVALLRETYPDVYPMNLRWAFDKWLSTEQQKKVWDWLDDEIDLTGLYGGQKPDHLLR